MSHGTKWFGNLAIVLFVLWTLAAFTGAKAQTPAPVTPGYQICSSASGSTICSFQPVDSTHPLPVTATSSNVGGYDIMVANTPTVQNAAYSSGNAIGGLQTIAFFRTTTQPSGILNNVSVASKGGSTTALTLYVFSANPSGSTCTDKSAFSLAAADVSKLITTAPIVLTPAVTGAGATVTFASQQAPISVKNSDGTATVNLYVCAVVGGSVTPASTTDLVFGFAGVQD